MDYGPTDDQLAEYRLNKIASLLEENKLLKEENKHLKNKVEGLKYRLKHAYDLCYCFDPGNLPWSSLDPQDNPGDHT